MRPWVCLFGMLTLANLTFAGEYDFRHADPADWTVKKGSVKELVGGLSAMSMGERDRPHTTLLLQSPAFTLLAGKPLSFALYGGSSAILPKTLSDIPEKSHAKGAMGVGLRRVRDGAYVLTNSRKGNRGAWARAEFSTTALAALIKVNKDEVYTVDFFDYKHGGWGHIALDHVSIPGKEVDPVAPPPSGFGAIQRTFYIGIVHGKMTYSVEDFSVKPGERVKLVLVNNDEMAHNVVVCTPGASHATDVGNLALKLGAKGEAMQWLPKTPLILHATSLIQPGKKGVMYFKAPQKEGAYPYVCSFPGHFLTMRGVMTVSKKEPLAKVAPPKKRVPKMPIVVNARPVVQRVDFRDNRYRKSVGLSAVLVGNANGLHYAFDVHRCRVALAWRGGFVDMNSEWSGRGGSGADILGEPLLTPEGTESGLRVDAEKTPVYEGYRLGTDGAPVFLYTVGHATVEHRIVVSDGSLKQVIQVKGSSADVIFRAAGGGDWTSSVGVFDGRELSVAGKKDLVFDVTLRVGE